MRKIVSLIISGVIATTFTAYTQMAVGEWRTHLAYSSVTQVAESPNLVFGFANGALFSYDKSGGELRAYSKLTGLNDNNIVKISYSKENNLLFIGYSDANIDLMLNNGVVNVPDFMNKVMTGDKTIYDVYFKGTLAYLSTGIGVVVVDVNKYQIPATYTIKKDDVALPVYGVAITDTEIFASTSAGVYKANLTDNLLDYQNWNLIPGSPIGTQLVEYQGGIYLLNGSNGIYQYLNSAWSLYLKVSNVKALSVSNGRMLVTAPSSVYSYTTTLSLETIAGLTTASAAVSSDNNSYWVASGSEGLVCVKNTGEKILSNIKPNGPILNNAPELIFSPDYSKLYVPSGGRRAYASNTPGYLMEYDGTSWSNIKIPFNEVLDVVVDPRDYNHLFIGTYANGLLEYRNGNLEKQYFKDGLTEANVNGIVWITAIIYDKYYNLYMLNNQTFNIIKVLTKDNAYKHLYFAEVAQREFPCFRITSFGQKWIIGNYGSGKGILIFDDNDNFEVQKYKWFLNFSDQDGLTLDSKDYNYMAEDRIGNIWVATDRGPIVFNNVKNDPSIVYSPNFTCTRIKIPRNDGTNLADYLLDSEVINVIAVDGGNRKWLGTASSGLYLVSADGLQTIHHFTKENSPLLSNKIMSLAINPNTGEVFIGTDAGIISYKGDAIEGKPDYSNVYVYPNPVKPDYTGIISVTGLIENSTVKITDISGNLIYEGQSQGGQFSWSGKYKSGERVSTGIYLVWATNNDGSQSVISKIMMIK
ncbi:MAG: T9SS type A sorting domain-containing protein [Candidatus Azobacteroides sp.]|nr:T9SS type A sorting domain-containing protein [Candidatus Azobacteroides sp.]